MHYSLGVFPVGRLLLRQLPVLSNALQTDPTIIECMQQAHASPCRWIPVSCPLIDCPMGEVGRCSRMSTKTLTSSGKRWPLTMLASKKKPSGDINVLNVSVCPEPGVDSEPRVFTVGGRTGHVDVQFRERVVTCCIILAWWVVALVPSSRFFVLLAFTPRLLEQNGGHYQMSSCFFLPTPGFL